MVLFFQITKFGRQKRNFWNADADTDAISFADAEILITTLHKKSFPLSISSEILDAVQDFHMVFYYWRFLVYFISIERGEIPLVELKYFFIKRNVDLIEIWQMVVWCWKILAEEIFLRGEHLKSCGTKMAVKEWL